jgi:hypothetical protein
LNDLKTPRFTITMSGVYKSLIGTIHVDSNNSSVIVTNNNLVVKDINSRSEMLNSAIDLSDEFELSSLG